MFRVLTEGIDRFILRSLAAGSRQFRPAVSPLWRGGKVWLNGYLGTEHRETVLIQADSDCEGVNATKGVHDVGKRSADLALTRATRVTTDSH